LKLGLRVPNINRQFNEFDDEELEPQPCWMI